MKTIVLSLIAAAALVITPACHKKAPVAKAEPPNSAPVAQNPATRPASRPQSTSTPYTAPSQTASSRPATMPEETRKNLNERLARLEDALFDYDKATIREDARTALKEDVDVIRGILADWPNQKLLIEGHCDERGSEEYNMALGDRRARAAEDFLSSMGISKGQLTVVSFGKDRPVCTDKSEDCWQKNRRAHVTAAP
ncbi:MAG TPA: OmpA family protein [Bryobacteraceae bacterium]|nr:OmpA family protein [Bryobacteraceae bacterium]